MPDVALTACMVDQSILLWRVHKVILRVSDLGKESCGGPCRDIVVPHSF